MFLADQRIEIDARPAPPVLPVLEVVMLGHCPGPDDGSGASGAQWQRVADDEALLADIAALGFSREVRRLKALRAGVDSAGRSVTPEPGDADLRALYRLPLPIHALGQFRVLFPYSFDTPCRAVSTLAGDRAWLPRAVQDFFEDSTSLGREALKLWVIRVPEAEGAHGFLPDTGAQLTDIGRLGAFERALLPPRAGLIVLPDLERLQVPALLPDIPRMQLDNPVPAFLPVGTAVDDGHRERRRGDEIPHATEPLPPEAVIEPLIRTLARLRPDMQCLLALPLDADAGQEVPVPAPAWTAYLTRTVGSALKEGAASLDAASALRHLQWIYPYLRGADRPLGSPCGLVAGLQALTAQRAGPWRSIGERPFAGRDLPWPVLDQNQAAALRQAPGVTVLLRRNGRIVVDDERLCVPCLPLPALRQLDAARRGQDHWYSAEVMRFMGWLQRQLRALGERLVFDADVHDPRTEMALRAFFTHLHARGALRGARPEDAYRLAIRSDGDSTLIADIEIAPAFPLDLIRITFLQDRHNADARVQMEALDG